MLELSELIEEFIANLEESIEIRDLTEIEKNVLEVVETARVLSEEGLITFWFSALDCEETIAAFDACGVYSIMDLIQSSQWLQSTSGEEHDLKPHEREHLQEIEEELSEQLKEISGVLEEYLENEF